MYVANNIYCSNKIFIYCLHPPPPLQIFSLFEVHVRLSDAFLDVTCTLHKAPLLFLHSSVLVKRKLVDKC